MDSPTPAPAAASMTLEEAHAAIAAAEKALAAQRVEPLAALVQKIAGMDFKGLAADLRAIKGLVSRAEDQQTFENFAITAESYSPLVEGALKLSIERSA